MARTKEQKAEYQRKYQAMKRLEKKLAFTLGKPTKKSKRTVSGTVPKDSAIANGFNPDKLITPSKQDIKDALASLGAPVPSTDAEVRQVLEMLSDMRFVYKKLGGRKKLQKMLKEDDKLYVAMVKELLKIESALMAVQLRKPETGGNGGEGRQNFFVVIKGLEQEKRVMKQFGREGSPPIDVEHLITKTLNPLNLGNPFEDEATNKNNPPEMLFGIGEDDD